MKIPSSIRINGTDWDIDLNEEVMSNQDGALGMTDCTKLKIYMRPSISTQQFVCTLIHELLHALIWQNGLRSVLKDDEEQIVMALSQGIFQVFRENNLTTMFDWSEEEKEVE